MEDNTLPKSGVAAPAIHLARAPLWSIISILAPLIVGVPTFYLLNTQMEKEGGDILTIIFIPAMSLLGAIAASWLAGVIACIISLCRRERFRRVTFGILGIYGVFLILVLTHYQR